MPTEITNSKILQNITSSTVITRSDWYNLLLDPRAVTGPFPGGFALTRLELYTVLFQGDKVTVNLKSDNLPENTPKRWIERGYNAFEVCLDCVRVNSVYMENWEPATICSPKVYEVESGAVALEINEDPIRFSCEAQFLDLKRLEGFRWSV